MSHAETAAYLLEAKRREQIRYTQLKDIASNQLKHYQNTLQVVTEIGGQQYFADELKTMEEWTTRWASAIENAQNSTRMEAVLADIRSAARYFLTIDQWKGRIDQVKHHDKVNQHAIWYEQRQENKAQLEKHLSKVPTEAKRRRAKILLSGWPTNQDLPTFLEIMDLANQAEAKEEEERKAELARLTAEDEAKIAKLEQQEVLVAVQKSLVQDGFALLGDPVSVDNGRFLQVVGRKPSGRQVICQIGNEGHIRTKFDQYPGMECIPDLDQFTDLLTQIYGVHLQDKTVLWQNPDRLDKQAHATQDNRENSR